jgi:hypothetical protein
MDRGLTCRGLVNGRLAGRTTSEPDFGGRRETLALLTFSLHRTSRLELLGARARKNSLDHEHYSLLQHTRVFDPASRPKLDLFNFCKLHCNL